MRSAPDPHGVRNGGRRGIVLDAAEPEALANFWSAAFGWSIVRNTERAVWLQSQTNNGPLLTLGPPVAQKSKKNRVHFDLATQSVDEQKAKAHQLIELGAKTVEIGQGNVDWIVLADPEGNEFCVLSPK